MLVCVALLVVSACGGEPVSESGATLSSKAVSDAPTPTSSATATTSSSSVPVTSTASAPSASVPTAPAVTNAPTTRIVISKNERRLDLYLGDEVIHTYPIALGFAPKGDKKKEGDGRTPEGEFYVCIKNPESTWGVSLGVSYPSAEDAERGLRDGLIGQEEHDLIVAAIAAGEAPPMKTALGGEIYIHGGGSEPDWTQGCVGLDEGDMKELFDAVGVGTRVIIQP
jgi:murein L,D-transpeptidase YafK